MEPLIVKHVFILRTDPYKVNKRSSANISVVNFPKTKTSRNFYMYKGLELYNKLPMEYKKLKPETFKIKGSLGSFEHRACTGLTGALVHQ